MNMLNQIVNLFKALSDETRLRILCVLKKAGSPLCVCEIMDALGETQYNVSRHLTALKLIGLVEQQKEGRWVMHFISTMKDPIKKGILGLLDKIPEDFVCDDYKRLKLRLSLRKNGRCVVGINDERWRRMLRQMKRGSESWITVR